MRREAIRMQAASITYMSNTASCPETSAETGSASQGLKISSALQAQTTSTLFTTILQQGITVNVPLNTVQSLAAGDTSLIAGTDDTKKTDEDVSVDVCSLLMQLMVMNSSVQSDSGGGNAESGDEAVNGILSVGNVSQTATGTALADSDAVSAILQNDSQAASVLTALAASVSTDAGNDGQQTGDTTGTNMNAVLTSIAQALKSELQQGVALQNTQAAGTDDTGAVAASTEVTGAEVLASAAENAADVGEVSSSQNAVISLVKKENSTSAASMSGVKAANQSEAVLQTDQSAAAGDGTSGKAAAVTQSSGESSVTADTDDSSSGSSSHEKNKNDAVGTAENGANQVLSGTENKSVTLTEKTSAVERALNSFTDDLRSLQSGSQEIKIVLEPESLGVLTISVINSESGISVKIKSEDKSVAAIISSHIQNLVSSMQNKGITVDDVDVAYSQTGQNTSFTQQSFTQSGSEGSKGYSSNTNIVQNSDTQNAEPFQEYYNDDQSEDSTVVYRA
jgi:flagellar hook-length control protein FliK